LLIYLFADATRPERKRVTKEHLEKRSVERNMADRLQVQPQEDEAAELNVNKWSVAVIH